VTKFNIQPWQILKEFGVGEMTVALPSRINQAIRTQDNSSEVLVKTIQLGVVTVFGVLYLISPKTDAGTAFSPVPVALACYLLFNLAGLVWAVRRGLPNWAVYLSIVIDIALLMVLIWSFHIQ
jgi:adenylate cyclase